jgi:hypothetical protein
MEILSGGAKRAKGERADGMPLSAFVCAFLIPKSRLGRDQLVCLMAMKLV